MYLLLSNILCTYCTTSFNSVSLKNVISVDTKTHTHKIFVLPIGMHGAKMTSYTIQRKILVNTFHAAFSLYSCMVGKLMICPKYYFASYIQLKTKQFGLILYTFRSTVKPESYFIFIDYGHYLHPQVSSILLTKYAMLIEQFNSVVSNMWYYDNTYYPS